MKKQIYFANGLFSDMERFYNEKIVQKIEASIDDKADIYLPQRNEGINDKSAYADSVSIAKADTKFLLASDLLIAVIDGVSIDPGVASEIGVAYANRIPIIGIYTDVRQQGFANSQKIKALAQVAESQFAYVNLYTVGLIKENGEVVNSTEKLLAVLKNYI